MKKPDNIQKRWPNQEGERDEGERDSTEQEEREGDVK
jgi:hypothetical protein